MTAPYETIVKALGLLSVTELAALSDEIARRRKFAFAPGDLAKFTARTGEEVTIRIVKLNPKTVSGIQAGGLRPGLKWRVHPSFLRPVEDAPAATRPEHLFKTPAERAGARPPLAPPRTPAGAPTVPAGFGAF